jgi:TolB-like protein/Tfp pilus assembly protein PilF
VHWWWVGVVAAVATAAGAAGVVAWKRAHAAPAIHSIAVLPFTNLSSDASQEYFADAMTEELTSDLGNIAALQVISRTSAMHYKKTQKTVPEIARELNVDGVIEGSVVRSGDRVRITAQLIHAPSDRHLWAESYERDLKDVLALQSDIARTIAGKVEAIVTPAEEARLHSEAVNPEACEAYMRGRFYLDRWTVEDDAQALHSFEQAIQLDGKYALAYVGVAECYVFGVAGVGQEEGWRRGSAALTRALELKPDMGEAHAILGQLRLERDRDFASAEAEMKRGIALKPSYAPAHHWYSHLLIDLGRFDESLAETKKLMELDPVSFTPGEHLAYHYRAARQWDLAIAEYQKSLAMYPDQANLHSELGEAYVGKHMYPEAISGAEARRGDDALQNGVPEVSCAAGICACAVGRRCRGEEDSGGAPRR